MKEFYNQQNLYFYKTETSSAEVFSYEDGCSDDVYEVKYFAVLKDTEGYENHVSCTSDVQAIRIADAWMGVRK